MKVGLFFGSFNPVHSGHISIGEYFLAQANLDRVWYLLSPINPVKTGASSILTSVKDRYKMLQLALVSKEKMLPRDDEMKLPPPYYTYRTIKKIKRQFPDDEFLLILGADNRASLSKWYRGEVIQRELDLLVYPRIDLKKKDQPYLSRSDKKYFLTSSTYIREKIALKDFKPLIHHLPKEVFEYIKEKKLYS